MSTLFLPPLVSPLGKWEEEGRAWCSSGLGDPGLERCVQRRHWAGWGSVGYSGAGRFVSDRKVLPMTNLLGLRRRLKEKSSEIQVSVPETGMFQNGSPASYKLAKVKRLAYMSICFLTW